MKESLKNFKSNFLETLIQFLWRQWSVLGVAGYERGHDTWVIDPEALLLLSLNLARYEPRLFDEIMDWLATNGNVINIQRIRSISKEEDFQSQILMPAIASTMCNKGKATKWQGLTQLSPINKTIQELFFKKTGEPVSHFGVPDPVFRKYGFLRGPLELRGHTLPVRVTHNPGLLFKLRALWGINARAEIFLYLLTHETGHPRKIAKETYYFQKTVQDALVEIVRSGIVYIQKKGKEKHYWVRREDWFQLLQLTEPHPIWISWPPLFRAFELVWSTFCEPDFFSLNELHQSSELRKLMKCIKPKIEKAGFGQLLSDETHYLGEDYLPNFMSDINQVLQKLM